MRDDEVGKILDRFLFHGGKAHGAHDRAFIPVGDVEALSIEHFHVVAAVVLATDPAGVASKKLLGDASLSEAATWADCAKGFCGALTKDERIYVDQNPQHKTYHYTD